MSSFFDEIGWFMLGEHESAKFSSYSTYWQILLSPQEVLDQDFLLAIVKLLVQLNNLLLKRYDLPSRRALDTLTEIVCDLGLLLVWLNIRRLVASQVRAVLTTGLEGPAQST